MVKRICTTVPGLCRRRRETSFAARQLVSVSHRRRRRRQVVAVTAGALRQNVATDVERNAARNAVTAKKIYTHTPSFYYMYEV